MFSRFTSWNMEVEPTPRRAILMPEFIWAFKTSEGLVWEINFGLWLESLNWLWICPSLLWSIGLRFGRNTKCVRLSPSCTLSQFSSIFLEKFISLSKMLRHSEIFSGHNFFISWKMNRQSFKIRHHCSFLR